MTKNPFINAGLAILYIVVIVNLINYVQAVVHPSKTLLIPITMLSLFTLSAAVMGYLFLSQPLQLYLDGEKKNAVNLFLKTVAVFAGIAVLLVLAAFSRVLF